MDTTENQNTIFPKGEKASSDYFTGTTWVQILVAANEVFNTSIGNVTFEPGARNNWHTHPGGQILLVTDGVGYYQEKGKPIQQLNKGDTVTISPGIIHWHGASPHRWFTHLAINTNTQLGIVNWMERVTDEVYNSFL